MALCLSQIYNNASVKSLICFMYARMKISQNSSLRSESIMPESPKVSNTSCWNLQEISLWHNRTFFYLKSHKNNSSHNIQGHKKPIKDAEATSTVVKLGEYSDLILCTQDEEEERNLTAVWPFCHRFSTCRHSPNSTTVICSKLFVFTLEGCDWLLAYDWFSCTGDGFDSKTSVELRLNGLWLLKVPSFIVVTLHLKSQSVLLTLLSVSSPWHERFLAI